MNGVAQVEELAAIAERPAQAAEQLSYARWLEWGTRAGLGLLLLCFAAYLSGLLPSQVPVSRLPDLWSLPVGTYLQRTGTPAGWGWLALAAHGDIANLLGIALLAGCSLPPLLALVPLFASRGDRVYAGLCLAEVAVLLLAASGVLRVGH
ncbi:hypothetical protein [Ideonella sp.]|uniref:hypothetical protein n=1 Tax=Ideonella sp. TaxID=1929293 RepID=UPI002B498203|nr:hypothetical protein [Ideonella sp.]HJV68387.1 hypothetical protein [Ideonella sp.]